MAVLDWQTISPAREVSKIFGYVELPTFTVAGLVWKGASEIVRQYNFTASKNFTIRHLPDAPDAADYCLAIRYRIGSTVYRFKLWQGVGEVLNERLYANDIIRGNFVLEVWSTAAATATGAETIQIPLSIQEVITDFTEEATDFEDAEGDAVPLADLLNTNAAPVAVTAPYLIGLQCWYNESGLSSTPVATWPDQSGNARDLVQGTAGQKPTTDFTSVTFADNDNLSVTSAFVLADLFMVVELDKFNVGDVLAYNDFLVLSMNPADGGVRSAFYAVNSDILIPSGQYVVLRVFAYPVNPGILRNSLSYSLFGDPLQTADNATAQPSPVLAGSFFTIGKSTNGACSFKVREVLGYSSHLSDVLAAITKRYLSDKYAGPRLSVPLSFSESGPSLINS